LWFRGVTSAEYKLEPSLYRGFSDTAYALAEEDELRLQFQRQGRQMLGTQQQPRDEWEWYFLMRHYGAPTRLLDWTDGALIGLHFAIADDRALHGDHGDDRAVWVLEPQWLNSHVLDNDSIMLPTFPQAATYLPPVFEGVTVTPEYPIAIDPPHVAPRVAVQRSRFTIHGNKADGLELVSGKSGSNTRLFKIIIPGKEVMNVRKQLLQCGISCTTLFPDLDALSKELFDYLDRLRARILKH